MLLMSSLNNHLNSLPDDLHLLTELKLLYLHDNSALQLLPLSFVKMTNINELSVANLLMYSGEENVQLIGKTKEKDPRIDFDCNNLKCCKSSGGAPTMQLKRPKETAEGLPALVVRMQTKTLTVLKRPDEAGMSIRISKMSGRGWNITYP